MMDREEAINLTGNRPARSPYEITFKTVAIATTAAIAAGHLTTLRRISRKDRADAIVAVVGFFFVPTLPFATLLVHSWRSFRVLCSKGKEEFDLIYYLSAAFGVRATIVGAEEDAVDTVALVDVEYGRLTRRRREYDSRWVGRLVVIVLFAVQATATVVLVCRRFYCGENAAAIGDILNGLRALGATGTAFASIGVTLLNTSWQVETEVRQENRARCGTAARVSAALLDVGMDHEGESSVIELRAARLLSLLFSMMIIGWWVKVSSVSLPLIPDWGFKAEPFYSLAMRTIFSGIVIPPFLFLFASSLGRISQIRNSEIFGKAKRLVSVIFWAFLNGFCLITAHATYGFGEDLGNLVGFDVGGSVGGKALRILNSPPFESLL
jgi:hypothetical protein